MTYNNKIGYACTPITLPYRTSHSFILKNFSEPNFKNAVSHNLQDLLSILQWNHKNEIYMFRIGSEIIPFGSHPVNKLKWWNDFEGDLSSIGKYIKSSGMRVSMHPGQYSVLNSPKEDVITKTIDDIEYHCRFLDSLGLNYTNKIVLHIGGVYNDKLSAMKRFIDNFHRLSISSQKRLILENDEKNYNVDEVLSICNTLNVPCIFDNLHNKINKSNTPLEHLINEVNSTWCKDDGNMKIHYSDENPFKRNGAHADFINSKDFIWLYNLLLPYNIDFMLEIKDKELSVFKALNLIKNEDKLSVKQDILQKYKYNLLEIDYLNYSKCNLIIENENPIIDLYTLIEESLYMPKDNIYLKAFFEYLWSFISPYSTKKESDNFHTVLNSSIIDIVKIKGLMKRLCEKYNIDEFINSYFFYY